MADTFRFVTVLLAIVAASQLPGILSARRGVPALQGWRVWVVVAAVEILLLSKVVGMLARLGEEIRWWGTPATFVASLLVLAYVFSGTPLYRSWQDRQRQRRNKTHIKVPG